MVIQVQGIVPHILNVSHDANSTLNQVVSLMLHVSSGAMLCTDRSVGQGSAFPAGRSRRSSRRSRRRRSRGRTRSRRWPTRRPPAGSPRRGPPTPGGPGRAPLPPGSLPGSLACTHPTFFENAFVNLCIHMCTGQHCFIVLIMFGV